jgi:hypothetical protein
VLDEAGDVLMEQRLSTTPKAIREIFGAMPRSRIALQTGTHSPWVSRLLNELQHLMLNQGMQKKQKLWSTEGRAALASLPLAPWTDRRRKDLLSLR